MQTYFGAMRHCLVCSLTAGATNFTASKHFELWDPLAIHFRVNGDRRILTMWSSEERKAEEAYSFVIDQDINDSRLDLAS